MAYRESIQSDLFRKNLSGARFFWNVHESVGYGCKNHRSDVMLVQFFLNNIIRNYQILDKLLEEDGLFGGKTWRAIKTFQKLSIELEDGNGKLVDGEMHSDGCVSKVTGTKVFSTKTKTFYTILALNFGYQLIDSKKRLYEDIRKDPDIPEFLKSQLTGLPTVV